MKALFLGCESLPMVRAGFAPAVAFLDTDGVFDFGLAAALALGFSVVFFFVFVAAAFAFEETDLDFET
ncbi:MAG: hypothetical protein JNK57_06305, partial [Planctomycetaceae bacterium]|nr:hypothetical protein [Planctomycetaceae bacterium]